MSHALCPRQIVFTLGEVPGVEITATEVAGTIQFVVDVVDSDISTADLRALFFHIEEAELAGLQVVSAEALFTEARIGANSILDLDGGANLNGAVKSGFDVGIEWGTPGGSKDLVNDPVTFALSNTTGDLTLDDIGGMLFGAKLDALGGPGGNRGSASKLTTNAPHAPDAVDDTYDIFEDGAADANSPSKTPAAVVFDVLANDTDGDVGDVLVVEHIIGGAGPTNGEAWVENGMIYYRPDLDFSGTDTFWYCLSDGNGGQDSAMVTVNVAAVADDPLINLTAAQGTHINETLVTVTATQNDADGSEHIGSINWTVAGGLPSGVTITPAGTVTGSGNQLVQEYVVTTAAGMDWDFDIDFTATSVEASNGDDEIHTETQSIEIDFTHNQGDFTFSTVNQSIWGTGSGEPFHEEPFLGIQNQSLNFDPPWVPVSILPPAAIDIDVSGSLTFGFETVIHLDAGHMSADLYVTTVIDSTYNKTTDTLLFDTSYVLNGGTINATGPNGYVDIDFKVDVNGSWSVSLEPLDFLTGWANVSGTFNELVDEDVFHASTVGFEESWEIWPGVIDLTLSWPDTSINSASLSGSASDHILDLDVDVDAAAIYFFPLLAPLDPVPGSDEDLELLALNVHGYLDMIQDLSVNLDALYGSLSLEGGGPVNFAFGDSLPFFTGVSALDDGDGIIEFDVDIDPDVSLTSTASVGISVGASAYLLRGLPFGLDPIKLFDAELPIADFAVYSDTFELQGFDGREWSLVA